MLKCCGTCKFFVPESQPAFIRYEQKWAWPGKCGWNVYPIPAAAVKCWTYAHTHLGCPVWEEGSVDYVVLTPMPQKEVHGDERAEAN